MNKSESVNASTPATGSVANAELVRRVARAIFESSPIGEEPDTPPFDKLNRNEQDEWLLAAKAAIVEIQKPLNSEIRRPGTVAREQHCDGQPGSPASNG